MIVCSCFGITDREIRAAYGPGGTGDCPAGHGCGCCAEIVRDIATRAQQYRDPSPEGTSQAPSQQAPTSKPQG